MNAQNSSKDLEGLLVVTVEQAVAAPYTSCRLADAGARVIKVERPEGDFARNYDSNALGNSAYFVWLNRGKESIALDLKNKEDMEMMKKGPGDLVPKARNEYLKNLLKNLRKEEVAIANSMSGGGIAGSVEAGDEPPVNKRKKKGEPTIIARGCMPGARGRFKGGVELLANLKKNKYT